MSQKEIGAFLLRVGSSRYQDPDFKKKFPAFSSISRFGIGVLSTFMIADSVEITTCHPDDEHARRLTLRSVHGKYLIRLLDKTDPSVKPLYPHGTELTLRVRPSVVVSDVIETSKLWVVLPNCEVTAQIDGADPVPVGYKSTSDALAAILAERGLESEIISTNKAPSASTDIKGKIRVISEKRDGVDVAFAVRWSEYFREWEFLPAPATREYEPSVVLGTCVEGIRVEFHAPGYEGSPVVSLANLTGHNAPKTNVARSGLEATPERDAVLREIYEIYVGHVAHEAFELQSDRSFSPTWAAEEARYLLRPLQPSSSERGTPISSTLLGEKLAEIRLLPVEEDGVRKLVSAHELSKRGEFWTIESELLRSAEPLIREASTSASLSKVVGAIDAEGSMFPGSLVLCGLRPNDWFGPLAYRNREIDQIVIHHAQRRVDLRWVVESSPPRWQIAPQRVREIRRRLDNAARYGHRGPVPVAGIAGIDLRHVRDEVAIKVFAQFYILPGSPVAAYLQKWNERLLKDSVDDGSELGAFVYDVVSECLNEGEIPDADAFVKRRLRRAESSYLTPGLFERKSYLVELINLVGSTRWRVFDPLAWKRSGVSGDSSLLDEYDEY